jgi:hypothetical protein
MIWYKAWRDLPSNYICHYLSTYSMLPICSYQAAQARDQR